MDDRFDEIVKENERIVIGKQEGAMSGWNVDGGTKFVDRDITEPLSDLGCKFDGAYGGFQPKPAVEVIIVVMKPMTEPTFVGQALDNGKGITWLDDCRVPYASDGDGGRFPANLLVSDDVLDDGKERNQGHWSKTKTTGFGEFGGGKSEYFGVGEKNVPDCYSRFFSLDAWAEKNLPFLIVPKASKREKNNGCDEFEDKKCRDNRKAFVDNAFQRGETPRKNNHPTVKPIKLMSYLITMGSRKGEVVLDPFAGSMSTGCACVLGGRKYIMIEKEAEYVEIGKARLKYYEDKIQEELFK
jgi:site-specific DNA-methyltransferase (adenine-specific)